MKNKTNPRRKPATQEDVRKAEKRARDEASRLILYLMIYILEDKCGAEPEDIKLVEKELNRMLDSIVSGDVRWTDIRDVVEGEYDVKLNLL